MDEIVDDPEAGEVPADAGDASSILKVELTGKRER